MSKLFTQHKKPILFYIETCPKLKLLQKQIESHGGKLVQARQPDAIELLPYEIGTPFSMSVSRQVYSFTYIKDCIAANTLLDLKTYSLVKNSLTKTGSRKLYTADENVKLQKYVESHSGSPFSIKFWQDALVKGLELNHSADSLRYHWKNVILKRRQYEVIGEKIMKGEDEVVKRPKIEEYVLPDEDELRSIRVVVSKRSRAVLDFSDINVRCEEENVDGKFEVLRGLCSEAAGKHLSEQEVLRALVARGGKVSSTIEHFSSINPVTHYT